MRGIPIQQRAYSEEQKFSRRKAILAAASALFEERSYENVTMAEIASRSGVAKGTVYVYFRTKNELFLCYAKTEIGLFFKRLQAYLSAYGEPAGIKGVVDALGNAYADSPEMIKLLALLHLVLESNTEFERVLQFRRGLIDLLERTGAECERHLWFLDKGKGKYLLLTIHSLSLGIQQLADPSPVMQQVEKQQGMSLYSVEFGPSLLRTVDLLLAGMEVRAKESSTLTNKRVFNVD